MNKFETNFNPNEDSILSDRSVSSAGFTQFGQSFVPPKAISERHVACVFLLDVSGSMSRGDAIGKLNEGMRTFKNHMQNDERIADVVDVAIVTFGQKVTLVQDWIPASEMGVPVLSANGQTPLGEALKLGMEMLEKRKAVYKSNGTPYFRPWIFCITDGQPTDDCHSVSLKLKESEDAKKLIARCVCVENDPNFSKEELHKIFNPGRILKLEGLDFSGLFEFVSSSLAAVSQSTPGLDKINVQAPHTLTMDM